MCWCYITLYVIVISLKYYFNFFYYWSVLPYIKNDYDHQNNISKELRTDKQQSQWLKNLREEIYIITSGSPMEKA